MNGEAGIRTRGGGENHLNGLASRRFQPLSHLSVAGHDIIIPLAVENATFPGAKIVAGRGTGRADALTRPAFPARLMRAHFPPKK